MEQGKVILGPQHVACLLCGTSGSMTFVRSFLKLAMGLQQQLRIILASALAPQCCREGDTT